MSWQQKFSSVVGITVCTAYCCFPPVYACVCALAALRGWGSATFPPCEWIIIACWEGWGYCFVKDCVIYLLFSFISNCHFFPTAFVKRFFVSCFVIVYHYVCILWWFIVCILDFWFGTIICSISWATAVLFYWFLCCPL